MKKILLFVLIAVVQSCGVKVKGPDGIARNSNIQAKEISKDIATPAGVHEIVSYLASDELQGRASGSEGISEAATYIANAFKANGVSPYFGAYRDTLTNFKKDLGVAYNVVGFVEGNDPELKKEFLIIGAHYDHIGKAKANGDDNIANGANDNASGTATVMELARYFGTAKTNKRSIIFALFSAEEMGLLGSKHLAEKLKSSNLNLYAMLNFEMVGLPMQDKEYLTYVTGYDLSNLAAISNTYAGEKIAGFLPKAGEFRLFMRSDNHPFHQVFNVPSQTYSTFDFTNFEHYHKVGDEAQLMNYEHMASLINKFVPVIEGIANAATKEIKYN